MMPSSHALTIKLLKVLAWELRTAKKIVWILIEDELKLACKMWMIHHSRTPFQPTIHPMIFVSCIDQQNTRRDYPHEKSRKITLPICLVNYFSQSEDVFLYISISISCGCWSENIHYIGIFLILTLTWEKLEAENIINSTNVRWNERRNKKSTIFFSSTD